MRLFSSSASSLAFLLVILVASFASAQNGFFDTFRNIFRPRRPPPQPSQQFQPDPQFQPQQQQQQPQQQQQQRFQPQQQQQFQPQQQQQQFQPQFQPQQQNRFQPQQQQQQQFQPQQSFRQPQPPQNQGFRISNNNNNQQQQTSSFNSGNNQQPPPNSVSFPSQPQKLNFRTCAVHEPSSFCPQAPPNHFYDGKNYLLTWNISCTNCECSKFTGDEADDYCKTMGARAVSLDTNAKAEHFAGVSAQWAQRYYWTGGRMQYPEERLLWPSGRSETWARKGERFWSHTGGSRSKGPQPDNRNFAQDGCEPEFCVGVLNNFYADGIKWHDVACHHKKPTICEFP